MKSFLVIGLGRFGSALATQLCAQGNEVLAVDLRPERVQGVADQVTQAVTADARDPEVLHSLGARNFDCAVVAMGGDDLGTSALIVLSLKELGLPKVVAKASDAIHRKVLEKIGADTVVFPEQQTALRLAHSLSSGGILNFIELSKEFSIAERKVPDVWVGKSIVELNIRVKYDLNVIAVGNGADMSIAPGGRYVFQPEDNVVVLGRNEDFSRLEKL